MGWFDELWDNATGRDIERERIAERERAAREFQQAQMEEQRRQAAAEQARLEAERQRTNDNIAGGRSAIDSAFSQFDDNYFNNVANSWVAQQNPQIDDQYNRARDKLTAHLAGQGTLSSSIGANRMAELAERAAGARASAANAGRDFAQSIRGNVQQTRDQLYSANTGAVDPNQLGTQATGSATTLARGASTTPAPSVGDLFSSLLPPVVNAFTANQNSSRPFRIGVQASAPTSGAGSSRVIG